MSSVFVVEHLLSPYCAQHSFLRPGHAEVNTVLSEEQPVQKGDTDKAGIPVHWDQGCELSDDTAQGRDICLSLGLWGVGGLS